MQDVLRVPRRLKSLWIGPRRACRALRLARISPRGAQGAVTRTHGCRPRGESGVRGRPMGRGVPATGSPWGRRKGPTDSVNGRGLDRDEGRRHDAMDRQSVGPPWGRSRVASAGAGRCLRWAARERRVLSRPASCWLAFVAELGWGSLRARDFARFDSERAGIVPPKRRPVSPAAKWRGSNG